MLDRDHHDDERRAPTTSLADRGACRCDVVPFVVELAPLRDGPGHALYRLVQRTRITWTNVLTGKRLTYDLAPYAPVRDALEGVLIVRVHENDIGSGASARLDLERVSLAADQPELVFVSREPIASVRLDASAAAGKSIMRRVQADLMTHARLRVHLDQPGTGSVAAAVVVSVDLLVRWPISDQECSCDPEP